MTPTYSSPTSVSLEPNTAIRNSGVDLKANGEVSRMRSHKGNMPSLPQTKQCSLCPAKFTRTTHLNRHLRSHTNERLHRCNICQSQFTRSDLLTRHKRTCGDPMNMNRSRRKSCQACAESKIKCDLQYPCSKCSSRGRECIFVNDPETSRSKKYAALQKAAAGSTNKASVATVVDTPSPATRHLSPPFSHHPYPPAHRTEALSSTFEYGTPEHLLYSQSSSSSSTTSSGSSASSPRFDNDPRDFLENYGGYDSDSHASLTLDTRLFATSTDFGRYVDSPSLSEFSSHSSPDDFLPWSNVATDPGLYSGLSCDYLDAYTNSFSGDGVSQHSLMMLGPALDYADSLAGLSLDTSLLLESNVVQPSAPLAGPLTMRSSLEPSDIPNPTPAELQHYLFLFFTVFSKQIPLCHIATWKMEDKPPILIRAMQACGALFMRTTVSLNFITDTVTSTRDILVQEFGKYSIDSSEQFHMILAVVLLQSIGLFHQRSDLRISSNVYHGMLVMMIRRTGLITRIAGWFPPKFSDITDINASWRDWAMYETIKRSVMLSYLHDCCHCMYFSLSPSFQPCEFFVSLPCDGALWSATSAQEWYDLLQTPSPYGTENNRILGTGMQKALSFLRELPSNATPPPMLSPFAHFILIHTILRNIHACRSDSAVSSIDPVRGAVDPLATQQALHNWLQSWLGSPDSQQPHEQPAEEPPYVCNALPFYWLAQVTLLALQEGDSSFLSAKYAGEVKVDGRFTLMKQWLDHIRSFLRNGGQMPTDLWEKLMKISVDVCEKGGDRTPEISEGLLEFFTKQGFS